MLLNRAYYILKPYIPWSIRMFLRRRRAHYRRALHAGTWPIDPQAGATPPGWPGWPEGKRFSLVLSHDVEGLKGLARAEQLMKLDLEYGFRSSFNFVPEGEYRVPEALRHTLERSGFEVGVHGLKHDGKLYDSKALFGTKAARIRHYLQSWNAVGFRSPFMQHRLAWLHELGVEYDCSTFDTDPFEPQPDAAGTIFPFWVPGLADSGYVELPYTLPQDSTIFLVLREADIDIWKRKLDWVAQSGGMAFLNTHPDYMCFGNDEDSQGGYPVRYYEEFLRYAREKFEGAFWPALPREVSRYYCSKLPIDSRNTRRKVCMIAYTYYNSDNRVRRYAEALANRGDQVEVFGLGHGDDRLATEVLHGVTSHRIQRRELNERYKWSYALRLLRFVIKSSFAVTRRHHQSRYDLVHIHNVPDFLVFSAWYPRWTGAKLILDIHDIVPELFASKFGHSTDTTYGVLLKQIEKASAGFADHVIVSNDLWRQTLISRSVPEEKCSVFLNHVDPAIFYPHPRTRRDGNIVVVFAGTFQRHQGLDIAIKAMARLRGKVPQAELHLIGGGGDGDSEGELSRLAEELGLNGSVKFSGFLPLDEIPEVIANADLGIVPKRADSFGNEAYSTKIMELMSQGVPVVVSRTKIDTHYFDGSVVRFFPSGDDDAMAHAMLDVLTNREEREAMIAKGYEYVERCSWTRRKKDYLKLVDSLATESFVDSPSNSGSGA